MATRGRSRKTDASAACGSETLLTALLLATEIFLKQNGSAKALIPFPKEHAPTSNRELLKRYRVALRKYIEANASLEGLIGPEFAEAHKRAEEARAEFEQVRQEMLDSDAKAEGA